MMNDFAGRWRPTLRTAALVLLVLTSFATRLEAQGLMGHHERGRSLAEAWCVECHEVAPGSREPSLAAILRSADPSDMVIVEVPAFQAVADHPATTAISLRAFLRTPHANMPDFRLTLEQSDDLIAYILSLQGDLPGT